MWARTATGQSRCFHWSRGSGRGALYGSRGGPPRRRGDARVAVRVSPPGSPPPVSKGEPTGKYGPNFAKNGQPPMLADFVTTPGGFGLGRAGGPGALLRHTRSALRQLRGPIEAIRSARATCVRTFGACEVPNCSNRAGPRVRADAKKSQRSRNVKSADDTKPLILHPVCSTGDGCDRQSERVRARSSRRGARRWRPALRGHEHRHRQVPRQAPGWGRGGASPRGGLRGDTHGGEGVHVRRRVRPGIQPKGSLRGRG